MTLALWDTHRILAALQRVTRCTPVQLRVMRSLSGK